MDGIINRLVDLNGGQLLFPLILCAIAVLLFKWIASNAQSKGTSRKEFLELFQRADGKDDLWLSVAVRHHFGAYLPVSLIKELSRLDQPARAIMEIADAWELIDLDDTTGELTWRHRRHSTPQRRRYLACAFMAGYCVAAMVAMLLAYFLLVGDLSLRESALYWLWVAIAGVLAGRCLHRYLLFSTGSAAIERWLGMT